LLPPLGLAASRRAIIKPALACSKRIVSGVEKIYLAIIFEFVKARTFEIGHSCSDFQAKSSVCVGTIRPPGVRDDFTADVTSTASAAHAERTSGE
jgi:hypothetical protein